MRNENYLYISFEIEKKSDFGITAFHVYFNWTFACVNRITLLKGCLYESQDRIRGGTGQ